MAAPEVPLLIVSGSSRIRTAAPLNHRLYADRLGVPYLFDLAPSAVGRIYLHKLDVLRRTLPLAEWVFWIDDDAFFTDFEVDLRRFIDGVGDNELVFCRSPVNPVGGWTWMSSGQLFIRRTAATVELLRAVAETDLNEVRAWWDPNTYGLFTNGDQDAFVYQLEGPAAPRWRDRFLRLPWEAFNSRPYHYAERLDEHFVCHFAVPGGRPKAALVEEFAERMGTSQALCDPQLIVPFRVFLERSDLGPLVGVGPPGASVSRAPDPRASAELRTATLRTAAAEQALPRPRGPRLGRGRIQRALRRMLRRFRTVARLERN